ncbi:hypothetical protein H1P_5160003 [Hyella patelloides LEGE 07179]|uniref:Uncharacterized protein n=2 Tax=Hyella TaxID=945733 RepID=A0A563VZS6_9CYAN|nr:hypothetical protein H1P_5160003 [Hyella patelloides LEGE 07179]
MAFLKIKLFEFCSLLKIENIFFFFFKMRIAGKLVGFYIPVPQSEEEEIEQALQRLNQTVEKAFASSGMDEAVLADALDLSQEEQ